MSDIVVKFKPSGQKEIVTAIKAIQAAEKNLTVSGKRHNVVVANMTAKLKAQNKTFKDLGISYATVGKAAKGNRVAMQQLTLAMNKNKKSSNGLLNSNRLLDGSFATMRSHLLLFSFAMSLGISQIARFTREAAKIQDMERGFVALSGGTISATNAIDKLTVATNGTVSNFDLLQQANNAMILGVTNNSDQMAKMFDMAQRLGNALGVDVNKSIQSLVTGIGRQSRLMLDNIGIIVKSNDAYKKYAREVGKTADTLTDYEKRQAFTNAALDAAENKLKTLNQETRTSNTVFQQFDASLSNAQENIGKAFLPLALQLSQVMTVVLDSFDAQTLKTFVKILSVGLVVAMVKYQKAVLKAVLAQTKLGWGALATAAGFLAAEILLLSSVFNDSSDSLEKVEESTDAYLKRMKDAEIKEVSDEIERLNSELSVQGVQLQNNNLFTAQQKKANNEFAKSLGLTTDVYQNLAEANDATSKSLTKVSDSQSKQSVVLNQNDQELLVQIETLKEYKKGIEAGFATFGSFLAEQEKIQDMYGKTDRSTLANLNTNIKNTKALIAHGKATGEDAETMAEYTAILDMLTDKRIAMMNKEKNKELELRKAKLKTASDAIKATADVVGLTGKNAKAIAIIQATAAIVDAHSAALSTKAQVAKSAPPPFPDIAYAASLAQGLIAARKIAMSANDIGTKSPEVFQEGGLVGGRRHSQGGTIIEAERGEFVMSRNAVQSIGLETLNQLNRGGGTGNVVINVSGNVMTQDFVEGELAESIKEAIRRGSDFGLS